MAVSEERLNETLSKVLLEQEIDGLDEDLVSYMAGMLASKVLEDEGDEDATAEGAVEEVLVPFLESVGCPEEITASAKQLVMELLQEEAYSSANNDNNGVSYAAANSGATRKLRQGIVNMASDISGGGNSAAEEDANRFLWGTDKLKPSANTLIDAHTDKTSAKEKRKKRQELEQQRRILDQQNRSEEDNQPQSLVSMSMAAFRKQDSNSKAKDVQIKNVSVSLDNGTVLLESGEIKFAYQRRYGLIGENGVGKIELS